MSSYHSDVTLLGRLGPYLSLVYLLWPPTDSAWTGDPTCWIDGYTYVRCCGAGHVPYLTGSSMQGSPECWDESIGFTYERCCLAGLPRSEVLLRQMRIEMKEALDAFMAVDFPDFDCRNAASPAKTNRPIGASVADEGKATTWFWSELANISLHLAAVARTTSAEEAQHWLQLMDEMSVPVFADVKASIRACPLGVAAITICYLLDTLHVIDRAYEVERYELLIQVILERFKLTTLALCRWPIFSLQSVLERFMAPKQQGGSLPMRKAYSVSFSDFKLAEHDFLAAKYLRTKTKYNPLSQQAEQASEPVSPLASSTLRAARYLLDQVPSQPSLALSTFVYGESYGALLAKYARRLQDLGLGMVTLACGDEITYIDCRKHWWPSPELCIDGGTGSYALKYTVPALLQAAGLDVLVFNFDAVPLKDPRGHIYEQHGTHDAAYHIGATYYFVRATEAASKLLRGLLRYLYEHGSYVLEMWALTTFISHGLPHGVNLPYLPSEALPRLRWGVLDPSLFACSETGWDCARHQSKELLFFHVHSARGRGGRKWNGALELTPGTELRNLSGLLSPKWRQREATLELHCNPKLALGHAPAVTRRLIRMPLV